MVATIKIVNQNPYLIDGIDDLKAHQKLNKVLDSRPKHKMEEISFTPHIIIGVVKKLSFHPTEEVSIHKKEMKD